MRWKKFLTRWLYTKKCCHSKIPKEASYVRYDVCSLYKQEILSPCDLDFTGIFQIVVTYGDVDWKKCRRVRRTRVTNEADTHLCPALFCLFLLFFLPVPLSLLPVVFHILPDVHAVPCASWKRNSSWIHHSWLNVVGTIKDPDFRFLNFLRNLFPLYCICSSELLYYQ